MTQKFEHFEGREIGQLWRFCDKSFESYRVLGNVASLRECGDSERRIFFVNDSDFLGKWLNLNTVRYFKIYYYTVLIPLKVTRPSFFGGGVQSYFEALWYPYFYFYRKANT